MNHPKSQKSHRQIQSLKRQGTLTSPHSGHFMRSNLDDEPMEDDDTGLSLTIDENPSTTTTLNQGSGNQLNFDLDLSKLFACMSRAYKGKLNNPKFNLFKGLKLNVWDKMRLNNMIWREWFLQFVKHLKPTVCSFNTTEEFHKEPEAIILEGKYWKRQLAIITAEYMKWRKFYRRQARPTRSHLENLSISELLEHVGRQDNAYSQIFHKESHLVDDSMNEFTDTIFSTLSQSDQKTDAFGFANADFMQPNLVGLHPSLDDLQECMNEPFPDLLIDAFGLSMPGMPQPATSLGGSLNNLNETSMPYKPINTTYTNLTTLTLTENSSRSTPMQLTASTASTAHNESPTNQDSDPEPFYVPHSVSQSTPATFYMPSSFGVTNPYSTKWNVAPTVPTPINLVTSTRDEFLKPKLPSPIRPRSIAPRMTPTASPVQKVAPQLAPSTSSAASSLTQLLRGSKPSTSSAPFTSPFTPPVGEALIINQPTSQSNKVLTALVPHLIQSSASSDYQSRSNLPQPMITTSPQETAEWKDELASHNPLSAESDIRSPGGTEGLRENTSQFQRKGHTKSGFDVLPTIIPSLANSPTNKISKAAMLQKTADYAQKLKNERQRMQEEADILQAEVEALNSAITMCQCQLPATGVPVTRQHNDHMNQMFDAYMRERTLQNWKFYVFSQLARPLFDSFNNMVSTVSMDELYRTSQAWLDQHCSLPSLRPAVLTSLRELGVNSTILSDPSKFPEQARQAVLQNPAPLNSFPFHKTSGGR